MDIRRGGHVNVLGCAILAHNIHIFLASRRFYLWRNSSLFTYDLQLEFNLAPIVAIS
jgi:hypothetical protein